MRIISVNVAEDTYDEFKRYAAQQERPVSELIREAMEIYRANHIRPQKPLTRMPTSSKPKLKRRWTREEINEEILG